LLDWRVFKSKAEARSALFSYIEGWYNPRRRHGSIGYLSPNEFERHSATAPPRSSAERVEHITVEVTT